MKFRSMSSLNGALIGIVSGVLVTSAVFGAGSSNASNTQSTASTAGNATQSSTMDYNPINYITLMTTPLGSGATAWDASDVLDQASSLNRDIWAMNMRQQMEQALAEQGRSLNYRPIIQMSGGIEGMALQSWNFDHSSDGDVNLTKVELEFNAMVGPWASAYIDLAYDDSPAVTGNRVENSRVYLKQGFVNIGNLSVEPFYGTVGQIYAPYGRYDSELVNTPATQSLGRIVNRIAIVGYDKNGLIINGYFYGGETNVTGDNTPAKEGGGSFDYRTKFHNDLGVEIGAGLTSNIAESEGLQNNGSAGNKFQGFSPIGDNLDHRVPAVDGHVELTKDTFYFANEYVGATKKFADSDLEFNGSGAQPQAFHSEIGKGYKLWSQLVNFSLAYDHTWQALGANLPEDSAYVNVRTSFWKNTLEQIEFRHSWDYSTSDSSTGVDPETGLPATTFGTGNQSNLVIAQVGAYF